MATVARAWVTAATSLGGDAGEAATSGAELESRYSEEHRHYHTLAHVESVLGYSADLARSVNLGEQDRAVLVLAVCAHDVIYEGAAGKDERASAAWAESRLARCGVAPAAARRVRLAVLATSTHVETRADPVVACLMDADLAILAAAPADYDRYAAAVRREYGAVDDRGWAAGRAHVLRQIAGQDRIYVTEMGRRQWERAARINLERELARLEVATGNL
jgi:predicted metal-dependent HD superfamily phosphohydrolase